MRWEIRHGPKDYKTGVCCYSIQCFLLAVFRILYRFTSNTTTFFAPGKVYGTRPPLLIAEHIYPYLEVTPCSLMHLNTKFIMLWHMDILLTTFTICLLLGVPFQLEATPQSNSQLWFSHLWNSPNSEILKS